MKRKGYFTLIGFCFAAALVVTGCKMTDPLTVQNMERFQTVWEEDRRADLPPAKITARKFEFEKAIEYEKSK